jgi:hypothetical protein
LIFKDSEIAKGVSLARTKCEAIVTGILGPLTVNIIKKELENVQFLGVQTDGSNHKDVKLFPVVIRYFNPIENGLTRKLIDLTSVVDEKAETISNLIINNLKELQCEEKCKAFGGDNCNTNFGSVSHSGNCNVYSFLQKEFGSIEGSGCSAHVLNNSIQHAVDSMDINIEQVLFKIYQYFSIYTVRVESLKGFCAFVEIEYRKMLSFSKTRWLSLHPAINRVLEMFPALKSYFLSQDKPPVILKQLFENPLSEGYL